MHANNGQWNDVIGNRTGHFESRQRSPYEDFEGVPSDLSCGLKGKSHLWQDFVSRVLYLPSSSSCTTCQHLVSREGTPLKATVRLLDIPTIEDLAVSGNKELI
jgi:hypothetical protein